MPALKFKDLKELLQGGSESFFSLLKAKKNGDRDAGHVNIWCEDFYVTEA
jgi:hypothetical protein